ncbi:MAG: zinc-ribbon domain-containing protein [Acidobacteria bacterium]|nr:zinc-ribbon domain-containing protein [Acidobacteriota bacterium]
MPSHCSCGAELPPDARFCHKCGRPLFEPLVEEEAPNADEIVAAVIAEPALPLEINFRNPVAVRTALITAMVGSVLSSLPIPPPGLWLLVSLILAGFLAVFLYSRRTGQSLTMVAGARMGWITGLFSFVISTVLFTFSVILIANKGGFEAFYKEQMQAHMSQQADMEQFLQLLQTPAGLAVVLFLTLGMLFILFTVFPTLGGVLGAKVLERDRA